jgi:hypothetical protein
MGSACLCSVTSVGLQLEFLLVGIPDLKPCILCPMVLVSQAGISVPLCGRIAARNLLPRSFLSELCVNNKACISEQGNPQISWKKNQKKKKKKKK